MKQYLKQLAATAEALRIVHNYEAAKKAAIRKQVRVNGGQNSALHLLFDKKAIEDSSL
jgi:hypothetical protein